MTAPPAPAPAPSTSAPPSAPKRRGPPRESCEACRYRRIKCVRTDGPGAPCDKCKKKGIACTTVQPTAPNTWTGKRIETAKQVFGSLSPPSSSLALIPSGLSTRLADGEMSETLGLELLTLYGDATRSCCEPLFPPPVVDYIALRDRYRLAGRRLSEMSAKDQLVGRIVFATASRLGSAAAASTNTSGNRSLLAKQLLVNTQTLADLAAIWRHPSPHNAASLLLLYQLVNQGEITNEEARPYLAALVGQLRVLGRTSPEVLVSAEGTRPAGLVACLGAFDAFAAVERMEEPIVSDREYGRLFLRRRLPVAPVDDLPSIAAIRSALSAFDHSTLSKHLLSSLSAVTDLGRRLGRCLEGLKGLKTAAGPGPEETQLELELELEVGAVWVRTNEVGEWGREVLEVGRRVGGVDDFAATLLDMYVSLVSGAAVFFQLAIVLALKDRPQDSGSSLFQLQGGFPLTLSQYLRSIRATTDGNNFLTVFTGTAWSVSRLVIFSQHFVRTSALEPPLHPGGMGDKLSSLNFLHDTLTSVASSYSSSALTEAIKSVESEQASLQVFLGGASLTSLPTPALTRSFNPLPPNLVASLLAPPDPLTGRLTAGPTSVPSPVSDPSFPLFVPLKPSLTRIASWMHVLDREERLAAIMHRSSGGEVETQQSSWDGTSQLLLDGSRTNLLGSEWKISGEDSPFDVFAGLSWAECGLDSSQAVPPLVSETLSRQGGGAIGDLAAPSSQGAVDSSRLSGMSSEVGNLAKLGLPSAGLTSLAPPYASGLPEAQTTFEQPSVVALPPLVQHPYPVDYTSFPFPSAPKSTLPSSLALAAPAPEGAPPSSATFLARPSAAPFPPIPLAFSSYTDAPLPSTTSTPSAAPSLSIPPLRPGLPALPKAAAEASDGEANGVLVGGIEAESDYLTAFLATLVEEAGPSSPPSSALTVNEGPGAKGAFLPSGLCGGGWDEMTGVDVDCDGGGGSVGVEVSGVKEGKGKVGVAEVDELGQLPLFFV